ncbi:hypothetical protein CLF_106698 [Clonorchis sinensis]|uniref:Uncharacterized protein n=1 Tax=Clonorchis sinensis TaxID=79923 RepID=G7YQ56_CLOSI|nr:hypothetical protein CLF_106698 [Clonorchis sinensis]
MTGKNSKIRSTLLIMGNHLRVPKVPVNRMKPKIIVRYRRLNNAEMKELEQSNHTQCDQLGTTIATCIPTEGILAQNHLQAVQDDFVIENTAALADGDGELDSSEKPSVDLKKETQVKVVEDGKTESAEDRQPTQMTLATLEVCTIHYERNVAPSILEFGSDILISDFATRLSDNVFLAIRCFRLEDIEENTVYASDIELQTTSFVQSVEPQQACMLTTGNVTSIEVTKITEPPQPPSTAPPLAACISSTVDNSRSDSVTTSGEQVAQAPETDQESVESKPKPPLSSINQLSDLDASADQTDADSEYDGTHVINMLSEIIESSLSEMRLTDSQDQHTTDGSTQASSVCDDVHTSEASMETVKAAHSPTRLGSPSNSSTSASEGSEDIEPFPPPPPESLVDLYLAHDGTLTHTHHLFSGALDEVIEEEGAVGEPESDIGGTTVQSDADSTLIERTTDEEKQDLSSPEPNVGENFNDGELTSQVEVNPEAATEQGSVEFEIGANEAEQQDSVLDSAQPPMSQTAPEDVQMNEDRDRDTAMPENPVHQSEDVDDSSREAAGLPSEQFRQNEGSVNVCSTNHSTIYTNRKWSKHPLRYRTGKSLDRHNPDNYWGVVVRVVGLADFWLPNCCPVGFKRVSCYLTARMWGTEAQLMLGTPSTLIINTDPSLPYNQDLFEGLIVKKRIKVDGKGPSASSLQSFRGAYTSKHSRRHFCRQSVVVHQTDKR